MVIYLLINGVRNLIIVLIGISLVLVKIRVLAIDGNILVKTPELFLIR